MSASSSWVTCGIITQLRARFGPLIFLIRDSGDALDLAVLREVDLRPRGQLEPGIPPPPGRRRVRRRLHVLLGDPALAAGALDRDEIDAELAREPAHRGARVDRARRARSSRRLGRSCGSEAAARRCAASSGAVGLLLLGQRPPTRPAPPGSDRASPRPARSARSRCPRRPCRRPSTLSSDDLPANGDGTSIVALSDSSVTSGVSAPTSSPGLTRISITGTSAKSPMSGP